MLSVTFIKNLTVKLQTTSDNVVREYLQHLTLSYLYQLPHTQDLFFKGGTAIRFIHQSPRFSEDLDFETNLHDIKIWENVVTDLLIVLGNEIKPEILESKSTTGGYLCVLSFQAYDLSIRIKFEISFHKHDATGQLQTIPNLYLPPYTLFAVTSPALVDGKLTALLARIKARDFYDLYFLLRLGLLSTSHKQQLAHVKKLLDIHPLNFSVELKRFLPHSHSPFIHTFRESLLSELERFIR